MEICDIEKLIIDRNDKINVPFVHDEGYEFCKKFLDNNKISSIDGFIDMDIYDACKCLRYLKGKGKYSIDDCCDFIDRSKDYIQSIDCDAFEVLIDMIYRFSRMEKVDEIIEYIREESSLVARSKLVGFEYKDLFPLERDYDRIEGNKWYRKLLKELRELQKETDLASLIEEACSNGEYFSIIVGLIFSQKQMKEEKASILKAIDEKTTKDPNSKFAKRYLTSYYKDTYRIKDMLSELEIINSFVRNESYSEKSHNDSAKKETEANNRAITNLKNSSKNEEITDARTIVKKIKNNEIKRQFLNYIYEHNMKYYAKLNEEIVRIRKNTSTEYLNELKAYNITVGVDVVKQLMYNNFEDFKIILKILNKLNLNNNQIISILKFTNLEIVNKVDKYINEEIINIDFVREKISIFNPNSNFIDIIDKNINIFVNHNINPKLFVKTPDILLSVNDMLEKNIEYLETYGYKDYLKTTKDFMFLLDNQLVEKIDRLIELGYGDILEEDLGLLNSKHLKRLELLDDMNIPISNIDDLRNVLYNDDFIISDDELDNYIFNVLEYEEQKDLSIDIKSLEENRKDKRSYSLNDVTISSNKVKRLLDEGYDMYDAIFHNMIMNQDEYDKLNSKIKSYK